MGRKNSSTTRVQPVFRELLERDPLGQDWLSELLALTNNHSSFAQGLASDTGRILQARSIESFFELKVPPPTRFLKWLVQHPEQMTWPQNANGRVKFGPDTQTWRQKLFGEQGAAAQQEAMNTALSEIDTKGGVKSRRQWWAFEGFTSVDCLIETEKLVLFIEGKRTDILSPATDWFQRRNQLTRNLEAAKEMSGHKEYALLLITEHAYPPISQVEVCRGLPHFLEQEQVDLIGHFLGSVVWKEVCQVTGVNYFALPDNIDDATSL
jgi:hypothetical protein